MRHERFEAPQDRHWAAPIRVHIGNGMAEFVRGPSEALYYLNFRWPTLRGKYHARAIASCTAALDGSLASEQARAEFLRACEEAAMLN